MRPIARMAAEVCGDNDLATSTLRVLEETALAVRNDILDLLIAPVLRPQPPVPVDQSFSLVGITEVIASECAAVGGPKPTDEASEETLH